jgi:hypothetical protein
MIVYGSCYEQHCAIDSCSIIFGVEYEWRVSPVHGDKHANATTQAIGKII